MSSLGVPTLDVTEPGWEEQLDRKSPTSMFFCTGRATPHARKKLPNNSVYSVQSIAEIEKLLAKATTKSEPREEPVAARAGPVIVSNRYNPALKGAGAWLSTEHVEMIKTLLGNGFVVELLSERGEVLRRIDGQGTKSE